MTFRVILIVCLSASRAFAQSEMQKLAAVFAGRWTVIDKSEPDTRHPSGLIRKGEERWHTLPGGIPLVEEYHSKSSDGREEFDSAAIWWDATAHRYVGLFCAGFVDQGCTPFNVVWRTSRQSAKQGHPSSHQRRMQEEIIMSGEYQENGKKQMWREDFSFTSPKTFTQTLFLGERGQELKRAAVIVATRSGDTT